MIVHHDITDANLMYACALLLQSSEFYDAVIVGAGPAGASAAYYLAKDGKKVLLLDKKKFPRDKICGDAVCKTGIEILQEMGVYKELVANDKTYVVSPAAGTLMMVLLRVLHNTRPSPLTAPVT